MGLKPQLLHMIEKKGFDKPTPIQAKSICKALSGHDIMGQAKTGTGKTAAFGIPMLNIINPDGIQQGLVVCPTRELAIQVADEISFLGRALNIRTLAIYGGQPIDIQTRLLHRRPEIIIGTPGRLLDHMSRGNINLSNLKFVVLDEADEMLDMGFISDIEKILAHCPQKRQTFLYSATLPEEIRELGMEFMKNPEIITIESPELTVSLTEQYYYKVNPRRKVETICQVLDIDQPEVSLIFCRTKKGTDALARILKNRGYAADSLHGDMSQRERDNVMERFRSGNIAILVATDLAARGLDIDMITHVYNFDIPEAPDIYVHRIGRTGRAGRNGVAVTLVEPAQFKILKIIEQHIGVKIRQLILPLLKETMINRQQSLINRILQTSRQEIDFYEEVAKTLLNKYNHCTILGAALKLLDNEFSELENLEDEDSSIIQVELPIGRHQGIYPRRVVEFLVSHTSLKPGQVGDIDIQGNNTFIEVPLNYVDEIYSAFSNYKKNRNKRVTVPIKNGKKAN